MLNEMVHPLGQSRFSSGKTKVFFIIICIRLLADCNLLIAQNITNTLGLNGTFTIKDGSVSFMTLTQSNGLVGISKNLSLTETPGSQTGILFKGADRFLHTYSPAGSYGYNTFLGLQAGNFTMSGTGLNSSYNTGIGYSSLKSITTGNQNTAIGYASLFSNTVGNYNTASGSQSLYFNTTGSSNTAIGYASLYLNTAGDYNTAVGYGSLLFNTTGDANTASGYQSLYHNTTGGGNTASGSGSLYSNTIGLSNTALGVASLYLNTTGYSNTALGWRSLYSNTTGNSNIAVGNTSLLYNTTGNWNTALGYQSLYYNTSTANTALGYNSLYYNTTGSYNTALGYNSGLGISTGYNNTTIGTGADVPSGTSNNQVRIGDTFITYAGIQVGWTITSDRRWKQNILPSNLGLGFISKLNPVSYTRINDENGKTEYGLIAQEVEQVLKENNVDNSGMITIDDNGMYELRYNDLMAPMVKAIQELEAENNELKNEIKELKSQNEKIVQIINEMKNEQSVVNVSNEK